MPIGTYTPPPPLAKSLHKFFFSNFFIIFLFWMYIVTNKSQKNVFLSVFLYSGVLGLILPHHCTLMKSILVTRLCDDTIEF